MKKNTIIVFVLLCSLATIYWVTKKDHVSVGVKKISFSKFDKKNVDQIIITGKNSLSLIKQSDNWYIAKDGKNIIADKEKVELMLFALTSLSNSHYVTQDKNLYAQLGLIDENQHVIKLVYSNKEIFNLAIGNKTPKGEYYVKKSNEDDVYAINSDLSLVLLNNTDDLRVKNFVNFDEQNIQKITSIKNNNISFSLLKEQDSWKLDKKDNIRLDKDLVNRYINNIKNLRAFAFIDEPLNLINPVFELELTNNNLSNKISFYINDKDYLVKTNQSEQIYKILQYNFDDLNKDLESLEDKKVVKIDTEKINKILIYLSNQILDLQKEENIWKIKNNSLQNFAFDPEKVNILFSKLLALRAKQVLAGDIFKKNLAKNMIELFDTENNKITIEGYEYNKNEYIIKGNIDEKSYIIEKNNFPFIIKDISFFKKETFEMPVINEKTKGFKDLPIDVQRQLLEQSKKKMGNK